MSRKREKPYHFHSYTRHVPYTYPKRRRPPSPEPEDIPQDKPAPPPALVVIGLPSGCSVLDLKSRFQIYGPISRIRIDPLGLGFITFRSKSSADSALAASLDPSFGISIDSHPVQVIWANEMKGEETGYREERERNNSSSNSNSNSNTSKLLKGETPLSKLGKGNRLSSAIVNPNTNTNTTTTSGSVLDAPFKAREIIAYDDIF